MYNAIARIAGGFIGEGAVEGSRSEWPSRIKSGAETTKIVQCCMFLVISLLIFNFVLARQA